MKKKTICLISTYLVCWLLYLVILPIIDTQYITRGQEDAVLQSIESGFTTPQPVMYYTFVRSTLFWCLIIGSIGSAIMVSLTIFNIFQKGIKHEKSS